MKLYEYKLVVGKIKVKKYEVTEGRTAYKLNSSSTRDCFEYNDSNNLAKNEMEKVLNKQKEWERDNSLFLDGDVLYFYSTEDDINKAKKEFGNYLKNMTGFWQISRKTDLCYPLQVNNYIMTRSKLRR